MKIFSLFPGMRCLPYLLILAASVGCHAQDAVRVLIDTQHNTLTVYSGASVIMRIDNIAIGRGGAGSDRRVGDGSTPIGRFEVTWVNEDSPFRRFFGLNFPNRDYADRAWRAGTINKAQWRSIREALAQHRAPPSNTALGGRIGIHGLGGASPAIHARFNWTQGCIAVTNAQIDELSQWLLQGTPVEIR